MSNKLSHHGSRHLDDDLYGSGHHGTSPGPLGPGRWQLFFEQSPAVQLLVEATSGMIVEANRAAHRFYGYDDPNAAHQSLIGISLRQIESESQRGSDGEPQWMLVGAGCYRTRHTLAGGSRRHVKVCIQPLPVQDEGNDLAGHEETKQEPELLLLAISDITSQVEMAEELEQARRDATTASLAKSEFLATMSHEIRTPMNAIIGMSELLSETVLTTEQRRYVEIFHHSGEVLLDLINDILDLSKVEAGLLEMDHIAFRLDELVESVGEIMGLRARDRGLTLQTHIAPGVPVHVWGDPARVRQILVNLVGNALKFTHRGEVSIRVQCKERQEQTGLYRISVSDTGIGIAEEKLKTIFQPFTQADSSASRRYGGTGLGLNICRRLVDLMGGKIGVKSWLQRGSTFHFEIPMTFKEQALCCLDDLPNLSGLRTLLMTESRASRTALREMLESVGGEVVAVRRHDDLMAVIDEQTDGDDNSDTFRRDGPFYDSRMAGISAGFSEPGPPDLVLIDHQRPFPGMDGLDYAGRLKRRIDWGGIPLLVLTPEHSGEDRERIERLGVSHLLKPVKREQLVCEVGRLLGRRSDAVNSDESTVRPPSCRKSRRLNILLAEDSEESALLVSVYLSKTPHQVEVVDNGRLAFERFREKAFDVVLMDMQMPEMDGYTATRLIRRWERDQQVSRRAGIIALTANAMKEDRLLSVDAGCDAHLTKPIKKAILLSEIERMGSLTAERSRHDIDGE